MPIHDAVHEPTPNLPGVIAGQEPMANLPDDVTEGIRVLYPQYGETVYRTIYRIVLDAAEAQDLTQETFLRAYRAWDRFDRTNPRAWLLRIATNLAITHYRSQRRRRRVAPWMLLSTGGVEEPGRESDDRDLVAWLMRPLTPEQRALITLHYYQQISRGEIAAQLGIPVGTVASRINKAMQVLRSRAQAIGVMQAPETVGDRLRVSLPPVEVILAAARTTGGGGALAGRPGHVGNTPGAATGAAHGATAFLWQQWVAVMALIAVVVVPAVHSARASAGTPSDSAAEVVAPSGPAPGGGAPGRTPAASSHPGARPTGSTSPTGPATPGRGTPVPGTGGAQRAGSTPAPTPVPEPSTPVPTTPTPPVSTPTPSPSPTAGPTTTPSPVISPTMHTLPTSPTP